MITIVMNGSGFSTARDIQKALNALLQSMAYAIETSYPERFE